MSSDKRRELILESHGLLMCSGACGAPPDQHVGVWGQAVVWRHPVTGTSGCRAPRSRTEQLCMSACASILVFLHVFPSFRVFLPSSQHNI